MHEIKDLTEFQRLQREAVGYVVITDKPTSVARLHRADCPHVSITNFETKVLINGGENGGYYWSATIERSIPAQSVSSVCH